MSDLQDAGEDVAVVAKMASRAGPTTTSNYDRLGDDVKQNTGQAFFVPYHDW